MTKKLQESKLQKDDAVTQLDGPDCFLGMAWQGERNNDTGVSCSWSPDGGAKGEREIEADVCVIHYNQQMPGVDEEDQLLQKHLVQGIHK
jgi:hypothetical protein